MEASPALWLASLVALGAAASFSRAQIRAGLTPLAIVVIGFALWITATNRWANPSYSAAAPYNAAFLVGGFLLGRRAGIDAGRLFGAALAFALLLAIWGLWQRLGQGLPRARALFETPATLSTVINLVLLPVLGLLAWQARRVTVIVAVVILGAALAAAASRGGWLGLIVGAVLALLLGRRAGLRAGWKAAAAVAAVLVVGWLLGTTSLSTQGGQPAIPVREAAQSSLERLDLYGLALKQIAVAPLLVGSGYLGFYYLLEPLRGGVAGYGEHATYFVHNDYLQTLLELGIPGLAGLIALVVMPLALAWRAVPSFEPDRKLAIVASSAALGSMATHALVDFPFYIPICLLMYGAGVGFLDAHLSTAAASRTQPLPAEGRLRRGAVAALATLATWVLVTPVAAQAAASYAHRQWQAAHGESAAYWFEVARRIEPRDWRYHWYAGQFWFAQAAANTSAVAAAQADAAFADGFAANSREVRSLLSRIATHRQLRALLAAPAEPETLRAWADQAVALAPLDPRVRAERAQVFAQFAPAPQVAK